VVPPGGTRWCPLAAGGGNGTLCRTESTCSTQRLTWDAKRSGCSNSRSASVASDPCFGPWRRCSCCLLRTRSRILRGYPSCFWHKPESSDTNPKQNQKKGKRISAKTRNSVRYANCKIHALLAADKAIIETRRYQREGRRVFGHGREPASREWPTVPRDHTKVLDPNQSAKAKAGSQPIRSLEFKRTVRVGHSLSHYSLSTTRSLCNGGVTSGLIHRDNRRRFLTPLVCAGRLLTGWKAARLSPEEFGFFRPEKGLSFTL